MNNHTSWAVDAEISWEATINSSILALRSITLSAASLQSRKKAEVLVKLIVTKPRVLTEHYSGPKNA